MKITSGAFAVLWAFLKYWFRSLTGDPFTYDCFNPSYFCVFQPAKIDSFELLVLEHREGCSGWIESKEQKAQREEWEKEHPPLTDNDWPKEGDPNSVCLCVNPVYAIGKRTCMKCGNLHRRQKEA